MARGRAGCSPRRAPRSRAASTSLTPDDAQRRAAQKEIERVTREVTEEYTSGLIRYLLARAEVTTLDDLPGRFQESHDLFHLARSLAAAGEVEHAARIQALCAAEDQTRPLMYQPSTERRLLRAQWEWGLGDHDEDQEIADRISGRVRHMVDLGEYAQAVALADAWREARGIAINDPRPDPEVSHRACVRVLESWRHAMYQPTTAECLARIGYMDEGDVARAAHGRATGDLGIYGDPRGAHRRVAQDAAGSLADFERAARTAIDHPELFGGCDGPRPSETVQIPVRMSDLGAFAEQYADDPAFLGWSIGYAVTPVWRERFEGTADAHYRQAVYVLGHMRCQTPQGERSVTACFAVGSYNTDVPEPALATTVSREHLAGIGARSAITGPIDDTVARIHDGGPFRGGPMVERGADIIRTPDCMHQRARWNRATVAGRTCDAVSLDCPDCGERRIATVPLHRTPEEMPEKMDQYLRSERMYTHLSGARVARDWRALQARDGQADMSLDAHLPGIAPLAPGDDLVTTLFG